MPPPASPRRARCAAAAPTLALWALAVVGGPGCAPAAADAPERSTSQMAAVPMGRVAAGSELTADANRLAVAQRAGALALFTRAAGDAGADNLVISPLAVQMVVGMAYLAADEGAAARLGRAMHWPIAAPDFAGAQASLLGVLASQAAATRSTVVQAASRLFFAADRRLAADYKGAVATAYQAPPAALDLATDPEASRARINLWSGEQTGGHLPTLLPAGAVAADSVLVGGGALRFRAPWQVPLVRDSRPALPFRTDDGRELQVTGLRAKARLDHQADERASVVRLPYEGGAFSLVLVRPTGGLAAYRAALDADLLTRLVVGCDAELTAISLAMPAFALSSHGPVAPLLGALGAELSERPHLTPFADAPPLPLPPLFAVAALAVDERGTEATAADVMPAALVGIGPPVVEPTPFVLDRPFLFLLVDDTTGTILFLGQVGEPTVDGH